MISRILLLAMLLLLSFASVLAGKQQLIPLDPPREAPQFTTQDTQGTTHEWAVHRGKVLVVHFWASWCAPCVQEMPSLQRAWAQLRDEGVQVLAINMGQSIEDIALFTRRYPIEFPVLLDPDVSLADRWGVKGLLTTYVGPM